MVLELVSLFQLHVLCPVTDCYPESECVDYGTGESP